MAVYALTTAPETVSTQGITAGAGAQLLAGIDTDASAMTLSAATAAYLDEVAD